MDETYIAIWLMEEAAARRRGHDDWEQDIERLERESANYEFKRRILDALGRVFRPFARSHRALDSDPRLTDGQLA